MKIVGMDSDVHFGEVNGEIPDWRDSEDTEDADDEELDKTPKDVIAMLGFDPKDL